MVEQILNWVIENLTSFGMYNYFFAFGMLILCGFGLPIPEDITLVAAGVVSGFHATNPHVMLVICFIGVLLGDGIVYMLGKTMGYRIQKFKPFRKILPPHRFAQVQQKFAKYGIWVLFFARFMPGLRSPIYLTAGMSHRIPFRHFLLMDGFAALISVPIWIYLGYYFADQMPALVKHVQQGQHGVKILVLIVIGVVLLLWLKSYIHKRIAAKAQAMEDASLNAQTQASTKAQSYEEDASATATQTLNKADHTQAPLNNEPSSKEQALTTKSSSAKTQG